MRLQGYRVLWYQSVITQATVISDIWHQDLIYISKWSIEFEFIRKKGSYHAKNEQNTIITICSFGSMLNVNMIKSLIAPISPPLQAF